MHDQSDGVHMHDQPGADDALMSLALAAADTARGKTSPNPWVGAILVAAAGERFEGATEPPGGRHAEIVAIDAAREAGAGLQGSTLYTTLEPCCHQGRTGACTDAILSAGIGRVVVAIADPDPLVGGRGLEILGQAGVEVSLGVLGTEAAAQLAPYLKHRRTGRPYVTLKMASTLDGRSAAPDGTSRWITGPDARADVHRLRAAHDAVLVGAGTVRADDPELTVRMVEGSQPRRVVLGRAGPGAKVQPALELSGDLTEVLDELGRQGILSVLVEGGATVAGSFHRAALVDRYVLYLAPALMGGADGRGLFGGPGAATMDEVWRGRIVGVQRLGEDLRVDLEAQVRPQADAA
ncbi:MAG TPA: bifunctional diaminohydroxyphosphoribosylaminopyrimidine deaminase/5-amino-6-(5-phosphoribosylamino)uracil reductase RibD [Acidimicrobiales bacterium]|nr:bifunctional diaminohydroxyphosphoribosylaminopyrimidine deaminase/5-amino-6-(5-phosphoribosylamino)uracil reductase RibD [Acidimicrobiales bacterium]